MNPDWEFERNKVIQQQRDLLSRAMGSVMHRRAGLTAGDVLAACLESLNDWTALNQHKVDFNGKGDTMDALEALITTLAHQRAEARDEEVQIGVSPGWVELMTSILRLIQFAKERGVHDFAIANCFTAAANTVIQEFTRGLHPNQLRYLESMRFECEAELSAVDMMIGVLKEHIEQTERRREPALTVVTEGSDVG